MRQTTLEPTTTNQDYGLKDAILQENIAELDPTQQNWVYSKDFQYSFSVLNSFRTRKQERSRQLAKLVDQIESQSRLLALLQQKCQ